MVHQFPPDVYTVAKYSTDPWALLRVARAGAYFGLKRTSHSSWTHARERSTTSSEADEDNLYLGSHSPLVFSVDI